MGFPGDRGLVKTDLPYTTLERQFKFCLWLSEAFTRNNLSFSYVQEISSVKVCLCDLADFFQVGGFSSLVFILFYVNGNLIPSRWFLKKAWTTWGSDPSKASSVYIIYVTLCILTLLCIFLSSKIVPYFLTGEKSYCITLLTEVYFPSDSDPNNSGSNFVFLRLQKFEQNCNWKLFSYIQIGQKPYLPAL